MRIRKRGQTGTRYSFRGTKRNECLLEKTREAEGSIFKVRSLKRHWRDSPGSWMSVKDLFSRNWFTVFSGSGTISIGYWPISLKNLQVSLRRPLII